MEKTLENLIYRDMHLLIKLVKYQKKVTYKQNDIMRIRLESEVKSVWELLRDTIDMMEEKSIKEVLLFVTKKISMKEEKLKLLNLTESEKEELSYEIYALNELKEYVTDKVSRIYVKPNMEESFSNSILENAHVKYIMLNKKSS